MCVRQQRRHQCSGKYFSGQKKKDAIDKDEIGDKNKMQNREHTLGAAAFAASADTRVEFLSAILCIEERGGEEVDRDNDEDGMKLREEIVGHIKVHTPSRFILRPVTPVCAPSDGRGFFSVKNQCG